MYQETTQFTMAKSYKVGLGEAVTRHALVVSQDSCRVAPYGLTRPTRQHFIVRGGLNAMKVRRKKTFKESTQELHKGQEV